jgi:predicted nucleic acid-binding protein
MENQYTIVDAKNKLPSIIHYVETGQTVKLTRYGQIAAVARVNGMTLVTRNTNDFSSFDDLRVLNWHKSE